VSTPATAVPGGQGVALLRLSHQRAVEPGTAGAPPAADFSSCSQRAETHFSTDEEAEVAVGQWHFAVLRAFTVATAVAADSLASELRVYRGRELVRLPHLELESRDHSTPAPYHERHAADSSVRRGMVSLGKRDQPPDVQAMLVCWAG
jgi:hypothetical protein